MKEQIIKLNSECPVNSHNEWDPLEEVIVGNVDHAIFNLGVPYAQQMFSKNEMSKFLKQFSILSPFPKTYINKARDSLKGFIHILHVRWRNCDPECVRAEYVLFERDEQFTS